MRQLIRLYFLLLFFPLYSGWEFEDNGSIFQLVGPDAKITLGTDVPDFKGRIKLSSTTLYDTCITSTIGDHKLSFNSARLEFGPGSVIFTGDLKISATGSNQLAMYGNNTMTLSDVVPYSILLSGPANRIIGTPDFFEEITLSDSSTTLELGISSKLNNHINLNGGALLLLKDLSFKDNVVLKGDGLVDVNNFSFKLPTASDYEWSGNIQFERARDVTMTGRTTLTGTWSFGSGAQQLFGQGFVLNLTGGGTLTTGTTTTTLEIANVHIKGLGDGAGFGKFNIASKSTFVYPSRTTFELSNDTTITRGKWVFESINNYLITRNNKCLIFSGSGTTLTLDGVPVEYYSLDNPSFYPITIVSGATETYLNYGHFENAHHIISGETALNYSTLSASGTNIIDLPYAMNQNAILTFTNPSPATANSMICDCLGNRLTFASGTAGQMVIDQNLSVEFRNAIIENFDYSKVTLGAVSSISFGTGTSLVLGGDLDLTATGIIFSAGSPILDGQGYRVYVGNNKLNVAANTNVMLKNCKLILSAPLPFVTTTTSKITFQESDLILSFSSTDFSNGNIDLNGCVNFFGANDSSANYAPTLNFRSSGSLKVSAGSTLIMQPFFKFNYQPVTTTDTDAQKKKHFYLESSKSSLIMNNAAIDCGVEGIKFDTGTVRIQGVCDFTISTVSGKELELADTCSIFIDSGAEMRCAGPVKCVPS